jgi:hypothetical protein
MAQHNRTRAEDERRIRGFARWLLAGAVGATAVFGGLAAAHTHAATVSTQNDTSPATSPATSRATSDDSQAGDDAIAPSVSEPQQSFSPPVAQSGGS